MGWFNNLRIRQLERAIAAAKAAQHNAVMLSDRAAMEMYDARLKRLQEKLAARRRL
jgi:phage tail tape-measure protein